MQGNCLSMGCVFPGTGLGYRTRNIVIPRFCNIEGCTETENEGYKMLISWPVYKYAVHVTSFGLNSRQVIQNTDRENDELKHLIVS